MTIPPFHNLSGPLQGGTSAPLIICGLAPDGLTLFVNPAGAALAGYRPEELVGQSWWGTLFTRDDSAEVAGLLTALERGEVHGWPLALTAKQGGRMDLQWSYWRADAAGASLHILGAGYQPTVPPVARDMATSRLAQQGAHQSDQRYQELLDSVSDLIFTQDLEGRFTSLNAAVKSVMGYEKEELLGRKASELMKPEFRAAFEAQYLGGLKTQGHHSGLSMYFHKTGRRCYLEYKSRLVSAQDGEPCITGIARDVTERVLAERELRVMEKQLFQAQKMEAVGLLASGIAHDFNNLLQAVSGYAQLMLGDAQLDPIHRRRLGRMDASLQRAADLVRRLLTLSRKADANPAPLDLNREVTRAVEVLEATLPRMIEVQTRLAPDLRPVSGDSGQMEQVLLNLGANARDAMPEGGRLVFSTENVTLGEEDCKSLAGLEPGDHVLLTVTDTGVGMDEQTAARVFEPFFTTKPLDQGTGLGLSTVYGIVKGHRGRIDCRSRLGQGATFAIHLPALVADAAQTGPEPASLAAAPLGQETILLVDDEQGILETCGEALGSVGYTVLTAGTGERALEVHRAREGAIDLTIMDLSMPGMGGRRCLAQLKALYPQAKVLVSSGYLGKGQSEDLSHQGACGFINKPFRFQDLLQAVRQALDS